MKAAPIKNTGNVAQNEMDFSPTVSLGSIFFRAKELRNLGRDVIHLDAGEPDFGPPDEVVKATIDAISSGRSRYTEPGGISTVRKGISDHLNERYHLNLTPKQTLMTVGGRMALYFAYSMLPRNSTVGIISPDWSAYRDLCKFMGFNARFIHTSLDNDWKVDPNDIRGSGCNALIINNPSNPTGKILASSDYDEIIEIASEKEIMIIGDEVYSDYILNSNSGFKSVLEAKDCKFIFTTSLSKSYSMTGFRAGYMVADEATISRVEKMSSLLLTSPPEFVQQAAIAALKCKDYVEKNVSEIKKRRDVAVRALQKYLDAEFYIPDGALYIFPRLKSKDEGAFDSEKFVSRLLEEEFVSVSPGTSFGSRYKEHIRITLLQSEHRLEEGIERMAKVYSAT